MGKKALRFYLNMSLKENRRELDKATEKKMQIVHQFLIKKALELQNK